MWPFRTKTKVPHSVMVNCLTIGCANTPHSMTASVALALIDAELRRDTAYRMTVTCDRCGATNRYSRTAILGMFPDTMRPRPLAASDFWGIVLMELPTEDSMAHRAYFGDRVLLRRVGGTPDNGEAVVMSRSILSPRLAVGDRVRYEVSGCYSACTGVSRRDKWEPIVCAPKGRAGTTGIFLRSKQGSGSLLAANVECPNPSCSTVFSMTHSALMAQLRAGADHLGAIGHRAMTLMTCNVCGTSRCFDEHTFDGYAKI